MSINCKYLNRDKCTHDSTACYDTEGNKRCVLALEIATKCVFQTPKKRTKGNGKKS